MITHLSRYAALLQKLGIGLLLAWMVGMLVLTWMSGARETADALVSGKRFIVHIEDGRVEGGAPPVVLPEEQKKEEEKKAAEAVIPPPAEEPPAVEVVPEVRRSTTPVAEVSEDLLDKSAGVALPRISKDKPKPWQYYAKSFRRPDESPMVAIVITGLGHSKRTTEMAVALDERMGLSFSPYAGMTGSWATAARLSGHELYVDVPMQKVGYPNDDSGPYSLLLTRSNTENLKHLYWTMSRFQGYVGLVAPPGEVVVNNADTFQPIRDELARRGVMLLMGRDATPEEQKGGGKDILAGMHADVWIDEELSEMSIQARLATLEQIAQRNGFAIGVAQAYPLSLKHIHQWQGTLASRQLTLTPLSFITKLKYQ